MFTTDGIRFLESSDYILTPVYFFFIVLTVFVIRNATLYGSPIRKYFMPGLLVKMFGGLAVGIIYGFYYKSGDTFYYYLDSSAFDVALKDGFDQFFKLLMVPARTD